MKRRPFRALVAGPAPEPSRIFLTSLWFKGHNNPRYAELLPRLSRLDAYLAVASDRRALRGAQYRAFRWSRAVRNPATFALANRRYRSMFTLDPEQIRYFRGRVVADVDDPYYTEEHARLLGSPHVAAYVVTAERAARRYEEMGVETPFHVIPQGVSLSSLTDELVAEAAARKGDGEIVVGWMAAHLLTAEDRDGDGPLYNVEHLLELWDEVHARMPKGRLWLVGGASERVRRRVAGRDDIVLFGRLPRERALAVAANFDLAVYARTKDTGIQAAKVGEFIGLGVPTVSYDYKVTENLRETGAGVLVPGPREFVDALVGLGTDAAARAALAKNARRAGRELDWDVLARRYEEILDRYLPPA
ncbi:MAG TPA: glycosyltransferase [Gaiellaceae bacterium]|nr:glycosyltransferase [Gaiellaceae bacterium]